MSQAVMDTSKLVAVADHVPRAGLIVWWRMSGDANDLELTEAWRAEGLEEKLLPGTPGPSVALTRTLAHQTGARTLSRPLAEGGRALVVERASGDDLQHTVDLRARVDEDGIPHLDPPWHPLAKTLRAEFVRRLGLLSTHDVGSWLVRLVERHDGVRLRDTGGVYFVPEYQVAAWGRVVRAVHAATAHRLNSVPALKGDDAVASILDAVRAEAEDAATELAEELLNPALTARRAGHRARRAEELEAKVARYESLLGRQIDGLRERVEDLRAQLAARALSDAVDAGVLGGLAEQL